jgi:hypothetical protein
MSFSFDNIECQNKYYNKCSINDLFISIDFNSTTKEDLIIKEAFPVNLFIFFDQK